jgi:hypothetical protein
MLLEFLQTERATHPQRGAAGRRAEDVAKTIFKKVVWLGRATTFLVALAAIVALSVGLASAALAGTGVGAAFNLGKTNTVDALCSLVGSTSSMLKVDNNGSGTALDLRVGPSTTPADQKAAAPMKVDSRAMVATLTAAKVVAIESESCIFRLYKGGTSGMAPPRCMRYYYKM